jgi:sodium transport system permease protein
MNLQIVKAIFLKEIKETIRDSKTLLIMTLLPIILYPLLAVGGSQIVIQQGKSIQSRTIIVHISQNNSLTNFLNKKDKLKIIDSKNPQKDLKSGKINAYLSLDKDFEKNINSDTTARINVYVDQANINSLHAQVKLSEYLKDYKQFILEKRIKNLNINNNILTPIRAEFKNIAPKEKIGGFYLGNILPFIIIFMTILGAFYPAIDQTAGEKERGTLETLLTTPIKKYEIITGKFLTISLFAFITGLLNLLSMTLSMTMFLSSDKINFSIPWESMFLIFLLLIPTTMFFVALMMLVSSLANSFKDAQNYLTPVYLIFGFPAMVTVFPGFTLNYQSALIPVANVSLLIKDLLLAKFDTGLIFIVLVSTTIYSIIAIAAATRLFNKEEILLSEESNLRLLFSSNNSKGNSTPNFIEAITLYIITFALLFYAGSVIQTMYKLEGLLLTEILFIFLPTLLFTRYLKFDPVETLSLKKISFKSVLGSVLLALSGSFFILKFVNSIQEKFLPMPDELKKAFENFLIGENGVPPSTLKLFLIIAVSAAVCEEVLFRGPILSGIKNKFNKTNTIIIVGILFGLFHLNIYKLFSTSVLGMLITYIAISTGSIFNGIIFHLVNNGSAILLSNGSEGILWLAPNTPFYYYPIFLICFVLGIYLIQNEYNIK